MAKPFFETTRSLEVDGYRGPFLTLALVAVISSAWGWWFMAGRIATWEATDKATLEVNGKAFRIDAPHPGRVEQQNLTVGRKVQKGELLLKLETVQAELEVAEEQSRLESYQAQLDAVRLQGQANLAALERGLAESRNQIEKSRAELDTARATATLRRDVLARYAGLAEQNAVSELEVLDAKAIYDQAHGTEETAALTLQLHQSQLSTATHNLAVKKAEIAERISTLEGSIKTSAAALQRLARVIAERSVRAPIDGTLGEVATVREGAFVDEGFNLCTIVPAGAPRVLANFEPGVALGRIRVGQPARVRLVGYPWTQYGSLLARVASVGAQPRDGEVQVELELVGAPPPEIPLQHGMPGTVEVEIGRRSPLALALRSAGLRLQGGTAAEPAK